MSHDETDELEPGADWQTAEVPKDGNMLSRLLRRTPKPCPTCLGTTFVYLTHHGGVLEAMGVEGRNAKQVFEMVVCQGCGRTDWFATDPAALLADPNLAATVVHSRS